MTSTPAVYPEDFQAVRPQKVRPIAALRAFRKLIRDKEDTAQVFEIMRALSGRSQARGYGRLLQTVEGGRLAFQRVELAHRLDDPQWLARFAPGTVGAEYRAFREARGFTADGLAETARTVAPEIDAPHPVVWYARRLRDVHDIWHVLTGYGTDALGEACVVSFSYAQTKNVGFGFIGYGAAREIQRQNRSVPARRAVLQAWQNGRRARWLPGLDYEALFAEPLLTARHRLAIRPATVYLAVPETVRATLTLKG